MAKEGIFQPKEGPAICQTTFKSSKPLSLVIASVAVLSTLYLPIAQAETFKGEFWFTKQIFEKGFDKRYAAASSHLARDIVIFGSDVSIDEPILTYGGNVVIVADKLTINAPIDTRLYLKHPPRAPLFASHFVFAADLLKPFVDYDRKHFAWDNRKKWWVTALAPVDKAGHAEIAELPMGEVAGFLPPEPYRSGESVRAYRERRFSGKSAPTTGIIWSAVQSGNILLVVHHLEGCPNCTTYKLPAEKYASDPELEPSAGPGVFLECGAKAYWSIRPPVHGAAVFEVRGANAGRPGLGHPSMECDCAFYANVCNPKCENAFRGYSSGEYGVPAAGGKFLIFPIGSDASYPPLFEMVSSGAGSSSSIGFSTPTARELRERPTRCTFPASKRRDSEIFFDEHFHFQQPERGEPGRLIQHALSATMAALREIDSRQSPALDKTLENTRPIEQRALSARALFQTYLASSLNQARWRLLEDFKQRLSGQTPNLKVLWPLVHEGNISETRVGQDNVTKSIIRDIADLPQETTTPPMPAYLSNIGGVYSLKSAAALTLSVDAAAAVVESNKANQFLVTAISQLRQLRLDVLDMSEMAARTIFLKQIIEIQAQIAAASSQSTESQSEVLTKANSIITGAVSSWKEGKYFDAISGVKNALDTLVAFNQRSPSDKKSEMLLWQLQNDYQRFLESIEAKRNAVFAAKSDDFKNLSDANQRYQGILRRARAIFGDALRQAILTYQITGSKNQLIANLENIQILLSDFPRATPSFQFAELGAACEADNTVRYQEVVGKDLTIQCVVLPRLEKAYSVFSKQARVGIENLPLAVVPANQELGPISLFGLFRARDLVLVPHNK